MTTVETQIRTVWAELRAKGHSPIDTGNAIIAWSMNDDHPESRRARVSGPTANEIDRVLAQLLRETNAALA
jgi:hypothetical protein